MAPISCLRTALAAATCLLVASAFALPPPPSPPGAAIPPHPRLVLTPSRIAEIKAAVAANATDAQLFFSLLYKQAAYVKTVPPVPHGIPGPSGILIAVRTSLDILITSAAAHVFRTDPTDQSFFDRAVEEALNLAVVWPDWNTVDHALDTGEAAFATAVSYDWLYNDLNSTMRQTLAAGMAARGLDQYVKYVNDSKIFWWVNNTINWNCVCSSGGIAAAMAVYGDDAVLPGASSYWTSVLQPLVVGVVPCVGAYNSDSSWEEGPGYWGYASKYNAWTFANLASVVGNTAGLSGIPGVSLAARFPIYSTGANVLSGTGETFDWADAHQGQEWSPFAQWWGLDAAHGGYGDGASSYFSRLGSRLIAPSNVGSPGAWGGFVEALAFYEGEGQASDVTSLPTAKLYDYINVAVIRGPWDAPAASQNYLSAKGGDSSWNHNHLDLASFVFDFAGGRLAEDMGGDSYDLPGYFGPQRWSYYRLNSRGHNVLMFANESQAHPVVARIEEFNSSLATVEGARQQREQQEVERGAFSAITVDGFFVIDVTAAYPAVSSYRRGFVSLSGTSAVIVVDEMVLNGGAAAPANITWQLHTHTAAAQVSVDLVSLTPRAGSPGAPASFALLSSTASTLSYKGVAFTDLATVLPDPPYDSAAGFTRIDLIFVPGTGAGALANITVAIGDPAVVAALQTGSPAVRPIALWSTLGPLA